MKNALMIMILMSIYILMNAQEKSWIRINQVGYLTNDIKTAVLVSKENLSILEFEVFDSFTNELVLKSSEIKKFPHYAAFKESYRLNFTKLTTLGTYYIKAGNLTSPKFKIGNDVYNGSADFLLNYLRQQQCGYNPFLKDSCHTHDGFKIYKPGEENEYINVIGGWHDASDYLQYVTTSATTAYQMMFAYSLNPSSFSDKYNKNGDKGKNNIPDILDQAKWGLDWLLKMNPNKNEFYNQIADDRDHAGFRLPNKDSVNYGKGLERPVYYIDGKIQGLFNYKNRTTGSASSVAKFASAFSLGAILYKNIDSAYSCLLGQKAIDAYDYAKLSLGYCQTAPGKAPYFYEEENFTDDMQLAAAQLFNLTNNKLYYNDVLLYGEKEKFTPWMGSDTARHYQWYPFVNLSNYLIANNNNSIADKDLLNSYMEEGLEKVYQKGQNNPFFNGVPFIWCSNNLVSAAITLSRLYYNSSANPKYLEMETSLRDWLLGCNPWGVSMIIGLPEDGKYPLDPHSSLAHLYNYKLSGGLVDGPVYGAIFNNLKWLKIVNGDEFEEFQSDLVVYHDDFGDYSTNEPTMDGTAGLTYYFGQMQAEGEKYKSLSKLTINNGAIIRTDKAKKQINLVFTAHEFVDGYETILKTLNKNNIKASFFFTGDFYRNEKFAPIINTLLSYGNYLGAHSNKHILYATWEDRDSTIVSKEELIKDIDDNYKEMAKFGITKKDAPFYLPPFEWHNKQICKWTEEYGLQVVNISPGTGINQDWTIPVPDSKYYSSAELLDKFYKYEKNDPNGLNGFILLIHFGTDPRRTDKLYDHLDEIITNLKAMGYEFTKINETIN
ncbi:MAG: glycoside hydrolase family 9 protein [bacterium]